MSLNSPLEGATSTDDEDEDEKEKVLLDKLAAGDLDIDESDLELDEEGVGLLGKLKTARLKQIEETLSEDQLKSEKE